MQGKAQALSRTWARWAAVALIAVSLCACREQLQSQISEGDANEILATLYAAGIRAGKIRGGEETWAVEVDQEDLQRALQVLREHGLPREQFATTGELFKKEGLVSTPAEERIRFIYAVSQELSHTLSQIDGVISARVHPVIPANDPLASQIRPSSASVFIKHRHDADLQAMAPAIKNLVMRGIEGLVYDNIALTFVAAEEPARKAFMPVPAAAAGDSARGIIGVLATLLLIALGGLSYLWSRYRLATLQPTVLQPRPAASNEQAQGEKEGAGKNGADTNGANKNASNKDGAENAGASEPRGRAAGLARWVRGWRKLSGRRAERTPRVPPGFDEDSFPTDAVSARQAE